MLFLVISRPRPERPSEMTAARRGFWPWIEQLQTTGSCRHAYPKIGRGVVAIFDLPSNNDLHLILTEWAEMIPAEFDVHPLVDLEAAKSLLAAPEPE